MKNSLLMTMASRSRKWFMVMGQLCWPLPALKKLNWMFLKLKSLRIPLWVPKNNVVVTCCSGLMPNHCGKIGMCAITAWDYVVLWLQMIWKQKLNLEMWKMQPWLILGNTLNKTSLKSLRPENCVVFGPWCLMTLPCWTTLRNLKTMMLFQFLGAWNQTYIVTTCIHFVQVECLEIEDNGEDVSDIAEPTASHPPTAEAQALGLRWMKLSISCVEFIWKP